MTLDISTVLAGQPVESVHITQFYDLLTGVMTDQQVTLKNKLSLTRSPVSGPSTLTYLSVVGVGDTQVSAEITDVWFNLNRTVQFLAGSVPTLQRAFRIDAPIYDTTSSGQTLTNAVTVVIAGAPVAGSANLSITNAYALWVQAGLSRFDGNVGISPAGSNNTPPPALKVTTPAHTLLTASTEWSGVDVDFGTNPVQWATGSLSFNRFFRVRAPTINFVAASTVTNAYTMYLDAPPAAGTNATITNAWTLGTLGPVWFQGGPNQTTNTVLRVQSNITLGGPFKLWQGMPYTGTTNSIIDSNGAFSSLTDGALGGFAAGAAADVTWYRGAANVWYTPSAVRVGGGFVIITTATDPGSGVASAITYTGTAVAVGAGDVTTFKAPGAGAASIIGYIKVYSGVVAGYIPVMNAP